VTRQIPWDAELGLYAPAADDPLWWLSFADHGGFLGIAIVQAPTFPAAITRAHRLGVNPGGSVAGAEIPGHIAPEWCDRLLTKAEAEAVPEPQP
jgi:hypothetical protein